MARFIAVVIGSVLAVLCCAQDRSCMVPAERYAILKAEAWKAVPGSPEEGSFQVEPFDVEQAECILREFIRWHKGLTPQGWDSLMEGSQGWIRDACMSKDWPAYYRQYRGYLHEGNKIIRVNFFCKPPGSIGHRTLDMTKVWYEVDDGGDCYFQASIDLTKGEVIRFSVNGPVDPGWCR